MLPMVLHDIILLLPQIYDKKWGKTGEEGQLEPCKIPFALFERVGAIVLYTFTAPIGMKLKSTRDRVRHAQ